MCLSRLSGLGVDPVVAIYLRNDADLPTFGPHGTKLGHSWYQWIIKSDFYGWFDNSKKVRCLGRLSGWGVDPVVELPLRNAADYRLPTFGPYGTKLGHSWYQWIIKSDFSGWFDNSKKVRCLGRLSGWGVDPVVTLSLRNAAHYRLSTFGRHGTKLGPSWYQWVIKSDLFAWFDNLKKSEVSGPIEWIGGWSRVCTPPKECCRLPPTYFWLIWHQTRAFLISVSSKSDFSGWFDNSKKGEVFGHCRWM